MSILWFWEEEEKKSSPGGLIVRREKWQAVKTIAIMAATLRPHVKELFVRPGDKPQWILELGRDESAFDEIAVDWAYELFKKANERIK